MSPYAPLCDSTCGSNLLSVRIPAATSAGSRAYSAEAVWMVSSYPRGCVNDRTTSGAFRSNGSAKRMRTRTTSTTAPRLRNLRDLPYLRFFSHFFAAGIPPPEHTVYEDPRLLPEFIHISVVFYHHIRAPGLLLAGELAILYRAALFLFHSPLFCPRLATLLRGRDRNGNVELVAASTLEEKRY